MPARPLSGIIESFKGLNVLIVGDAMLDQFSYSKTDRISPEANVPVYSVYKSNFYPGGAANVAVVTKALGATPFLLSPVGRDYPGGMLRDCLKAHSIETRWFISSARPTTHKHRFFNHEAPVGRIDSETSLPLSTEELLLLRSHFEELLPKAHVIIIQDYNKGCLTAQTIPFILELAKTRSIPVVVDPKYDNIELYRGVDLLKPNRLEAERILGRSLETNQENLRKLRTDLDVKSLLITLGKDGIVACNDTDYSFGRVEPVHNPQIVGAGDAIAVIASMCLTLGLHLTEMVNLSNLLGKLYCMKPEMVPVYYEEFVAQVVNVDNNRTFD